MGPAPRGASGQTRAGGTVRRIGRYNRTDDGRTVPAAWAVEEMARWMQCQTPLHTSDDDLFVASALEALLSMVRARGHYGARLGDKHIRAVLEAMAWDPLTDEE